MNEGTSLKSTPKKCRIHRHPPQARREASPRSSGSVVRGEATEDSDIDLLVEFEGRKSLLDLVGLKLDLEDTFHREFDVLTYDSCTRC